MRDATPVTAPRRADLSALLGSTERVIKYLEALGDAINDARMLTGEGPPEGVIQANSSRLYVDILTSTLYKNTNPEYGQKTGWSAV